MISTIVAVVVTIVCFLSPARAECAESSGGKVPAAVADVVIFTNGDQLTGKLLNVAAGQVTFHSNIVGDITVPWEKIKTLHSVEQFAIVEKGQRLSRKAAARQVALGTVEVADKQIQIHPVTGTSAPKIYPTNDTSYLIDGANFYKELRGESDLLYGWTGSVTLGATLAEGTNNNQSYTGTVGFVRSIPTVSWLPPTSKMSLNLTGTYGLLTQPQIVADGQVIQAASVGKTNILHGDTEYDRYVSGRTFWLLNASADHNFGSGLQLQQTYGMGVGWSLIRNSKETFDLKTDLHYQQQQFYSAINSGLGTPNENLIGAGLVETWMRTLAHGIKFNQGITLTPSFNVIRAYSGAATARLVFPVYKRLNFTLSSTDNYIGDPPVGYQRNTFQFTAGVGYVIK